MDLLKLGRVACGRRLSAMGDDRLAPFFRRSSAHDELIARVWRSRAGRLHVRSSLRAMPRGDPDPRATLPAIPTPAKAFPIEEFLTLEQIYVRPDTGWYVFAARPFDTDWYLIGEDLREQDTLIVLEDGSTRSTDESTPAGFSIDALAAVPGARISICRGCREYVFPKHAEVCEDPPRYGDHRGGEPY